MEVDKVQGVDLVVRALKAEGIDTLFVIAGDHTLTLMDRMADEGFRFIDTRHEQAAVDMANAYGRITGKPGVTMFTTPGHANAIPGLTMAGHMESPVINIVGCAAQEHLGRGAAQELDQVGMAKPVTKGAWLIPDPHRIPDMFATAFRTALEGRRGPVHLTIPVDVQEAAVTESRVDWDRPDEYRSTGRRPTDTATASAIVDMLHTAERPMILASNGAHSVSPEDLTRLVDVTGIPVFTEEAARGVVPDDHPLCFGFADLRVSETATHLGDADTILMLGKKLDSTISFGRPPALHKDVRIIQVESSVGLIGLGRGVALPVHADPGAVVKQLVPEAEKRRWARHPLLAEMESTAASLKNRLDALATDSAPLHSMSVHRALSPMLDRDTAIVFEGSDFGFYGAAYHPSYRPGRWFTVGTMGMIGWGVPYGLGAKVALPDSKVVVLSGDGSFGFNAMEIDTAVRHGLDLVVVVGVDGVWGIDYHQQIQLYGKAVSTELPPARYDKLAEALGAHGEYVDEPAHLPGALRRAFDYKGPSVVNVRTAPSPSPRTQQILDMKGKHNAD
jgi:acetolactate synthase-1/2/3 large subunit